MERNREIHENLNGAEAYGDEPLHEYVKCVVIGDTAVGKTRLICSHAYGYEGMPLELINSKPHLPTVFAIDQYMSEPVVRNRARYIIDGVHVCLRIWDTFGDHDKNRKFAYQHAHVVVMCYSIGMPASLRNINAKWFLEIRKYCPRVPIILVGTQLDRRYTDSNRFRTIGHARLRSYLAGHHDITTTKHPLVPPELGRQTAREIGAYGYYETSIVTKFGIDGVFENAIRAALIGRRKARPVLLSSHLKRIEKPALQEPYLPPKPTAPTAHVPPLKYTEEQSSLNGNKELADVIFLVDGEPVYGHVAMLIASSPVFAALFVNPAILHTFMFHEGISIPQLLINTGNLALQEGNINGTACLMPRGFVSLDTVHDKSLGNCSIAVKVCGITSKCFGKVLEFLYTGAIQDPGNIVELLTAASLLQISPLTDYANNLLTSAEYMNVEVARQMRIHAVADIYRLFYNKPLFSDVTFVVDGNEIPAHKAMLIPHCQMMAGMFRNGNFRESGTATVSFNDTNVESFLGVLEYIYTGGCSALHMEDAIGILKLGNFLCLPRLVAICEQYIIKDTEASFESSPDMVMGNIFGLYNMSQVHNAPQLSAWCLYFMTTNYNKLCEMYPKEFKQINMTALKSIEEHRWPPVWYLKEQDAYRKASRELEIEKDKKAKSRRKRKCKSCF